MKRCLACARRFEGQNWRCPGCGFEPARSLGFPAFAADLGTQDIGFDASRYVALASVERSHFWFTARSRLIVWALRRHFPAARSMLEVGCGNGNVLAAIAQTGALPRLVGAEAHAAGLAIAARRVPMAELVQMDARCIPFRNEFDVVGAFDVIEHIAEDDAVLREMYAACRPGGGVLLTVPQHEWLWSRQDEFAGHRRRYRRRALFASLAEAGFVQPWATSFLMLLLPLMALSRLRQKDATASGELEPGRLTNGLAAAAMAVERVLIAGVGLSLPVGASLLAVAYKP